MRSAFLLTGTALISLAFSSAALAEDAAPDAQGDHHESGGPDIVVTAALPSQRQDVLSGVAVLQSKALTQALRPSIGETLQHTPGVSATSFGPSASRPILRGLQGERVRVLTDGIGAIDVSNTSVDHAVVVDPLLADRIEVLRGPQALLYGSSATGGVVNVIDKRIPRSVPDEPVHVGGLLSYGSAANERSAGAVIDVPVTSKLVVHADGSYLKADDLKIGGYALSPRARSQALASDAAGASNDEIDFAANAAIKGTLPNTAAKTWTVGLGAAYITDTGNFGISYSHYDSLYGVPIRYATQAGEEQEAPRLSLMQNRIDARAEIDANGSVIDKIRFRYAYANYRHFELAPDGSVGTAFFNHGMEGRLELVQAQHGAWRGVTGGQFFTRDFNVVGDEAFLPKNSTQQIGLFTLQQFELGALKLEAGARYEHTSLDSVPLPDQPQFFDGGRSFSTLSGSVGASYDLGGGWKTGFNLSRTERAPSAEELFANGPHAGTEAFEIGNPDFKIEKSWGVEGLVRRNGEGYNLEASVFYNWFSNFIYDDATGVIEDGLPVYQGRQADARYYGFELQGDVTLGHIGPFDVVTDGLVDYVRATIKNVGPAPRIPPLRALGGVALNGEHFDVRGEVEWVDKQTRISAQETPTDGYTMVNAQVNIRPWGQDRPVSFALSANNIFDVDARRHASYLKEFAPLAGRDIRLTARISL